MYTEQTQHTCKILWKLNLFLCNIKAKATQAIKMSDENVSLENLKILINGNLPSNMLSYAAEQAVSGDQVMYCMAIHNSVLLQWYNSKSNLKKYVDFLNETIPNGSIKIKRTSSRVEDRLRYQCSHVSKQVKKLNVKCSKEKRVAFLSNVSKVSILVSNVYTAAEMEQEIQHSKVALQALQERLDNLNNELEEWKKQFQNLENEKERLFNEMKNVKDLEISNLADENEEMRKYVRKLEMENEDNCSSVIKNIGDLSKRQKKRRVQALGTRAQKALWFAKQFGLELDRLDFLDSNGQKYSWNTLSSLEGTSPVSQRTPPTAKTPVYITSNPSPSSPSTKTAPTQPKNNQYENLSSDSKCKVEAILFLMDKFAVGDAFIHELSMVVDSMPKSYLIKQCRNKLNKQSLCYKTNTWNSTWCTIIIQGLPC